MQSDARLYFIGAGGPRNAKYKPVRGPESLTRCEKRGSALRKAMNPGARGFTSLLVFVFGLGCEAVPEFTFSDTPADGSNVVDAGGPELNDAPTTLIATTASPPDSDVFDVADAVTDVSIRDDADPPGDALADQDSTAIPLCGVVVGVCGCVTRKDCKEASCISPCAACECHNFCCARANAPLTKCDKTLACLLGD